MSGVLHRRRSRIAAILLASLAGTSGLAGAGHWLMGRALAEPIASGRVFELGGARFDAVATIQIQRPEGITSLQRQAGGGWVVVQRGGYPVGAATIDQLAADLTALRLTHRRTNDPGQYNRLGVGEPREGGDGTAVTLLDASGATLAAAVIGQRGEAVYVRRPGDPTVYRAGPRLVRLAAPAAWLDLPVLAVEPQDIASVEAVVDGEAYAIIRRPDGGFAPEGGPPGAVATSAALALTRWQAEDVVATVALAPGAPDGEQHVLLRSGQKITVRLWRDRSGAPGGWAGLEMSGAAGPQTSSPLSGGPVRGWLFRLSAPVLADFLTARTTILSPQDAALAVPEGVPP